MNTHQGILKGDTLQRITSTSFIVASVLLIIFNLLTPRRMDPTDIQSAISIMADQKSLVQLSQLMLAFGIWGLMIGSAGVYLSITDGGAPWARLGFYGMILGATLWTITFGLGTATVNAATNWVTAAPVDKGTDFSIAAAVSSATGGTETMGIIMVWLALIFLGVGMTSSKEYPRWIGWAAVLLGLVMVSAVGIPKFFMGYTTTLLALFGILALLTTVWSLAVGIWVARRAW